MARSLKQEIKIFEKKLETNPKSMLFARLADIYLKNDQVDKAIDVCEKGLRFHPFYASGHYIMAKCYLAGGDNEHARTELERTLKFDENSLVAYKLMGDMYKAIQDQGAFQNAYKRLWEIDPLNKSVSKLVEELGLKGNPPETVDTSDMEILVPHEEESSPSIQLPSVKPAVSPEPSIVEFKKIVDQTEESEPEGRSIDHLIDDVFQASAVEPEVESPVKPMIILKRKETGPTEPHEVDEILDKVKKSAGSEELTEVPEGKEEGTFSSILADIFGSPPPAAKPEPTAEPEPEIEVEMAVVSPPAAKTQRREVLPQIQDEPEISYDEFMTLQQREKAVETTFAHPAAPKPKPVPEPERFAVPKLEIPVPETKPGPKTAVISTTKGETKIVSATLGEIYISQGQFEAALEIFKALLASDPGNIKYQRKIKNLEEILLQEKTV